MLKIIVDDTLKEILEAEETRKKYNSKSNAAVDGMGSMFPALVHYAKVLGHKDYQELKRYVVIK